MQEQTIQVKVLTVLSAAVLIGFGVEIGRFLAQCGINGLTAVIELIGVAQWLPI